MRPWQVLALFLGLELSAVAAADLPPEVLLLAHIKQAARQGLSQIPAYACQETVERFTRTSRFARFNSIDRFQVEVAQIGTRELFARPGDKEFQDKPLNEIVRPGMTATGLFSVMATTVFLGPASVFRYRGRERHERKKAVRYSYRIAQIFSTYQISSNGYTGRVGMEGSFWADADTTDIVELEVRAVDIPPQLRIHNALTRILYNTARIDNRNYLIPSSAVVTTVSDFGSEDQNRTEFRSCRKYTGESTITF